MPPQIGRIAIVFGIVVFVFVAVKDQLTPPGFAEDGFHRKQGPDLVASSPTLHAGMAACMECHADKVDSTAHVKKGVHCESCHGAAGDHVKDWEKTKPFVPSTRADCTGCHAQIVSRPAWYPQIDPRLHNPDSKCVDCHTTHEDADEVTQEDRS